MLSFNNFICFNLDILSKSKELCSEIEKLDGDFTNLQVALLTELKAKKESVEYLTTLISCLGGDGKDYVYRSWKKIVKNSFENLNDLFADLNVTVWNILDHYLLDYFVKVFGSQELKQRMENYKSVLKIFKKKTLVSDFIGCWKEAQKKRIILDSEELTVKYDKPTMTLADVDEFREKFAAKCFPSIIDYAAIINLGRFQTGCFIITYHVPEELVSKIISNMDSYQLFKDFNVLHIFNGSNKIYAKQCRRKLHSYDMRFLIRIIQ